jgi:hypothetical protein
MDMNALTGNVETPHAKRRDASRLYNATATYFHPVRDVILVENDNSKFIIQMERCNHRKAKNPVRMTLTGLTTLSGRALLPHWRDALTCQAAKLLTVSTGTKKSPRQAARSCAQYKTT